MGADEELIDLYIFYNPSNWSVILSFAVLLIQKSDHMGFASRHSCTLFGPIMFRRLSGEECKGTLQYFTDGRCTV